MAPVTSMLRSPSWRSGSSARKHAAHSGRCASFLCALGAGASCAALRPLRPLGTSSRVKLALQLMPCPDGSRLKVTSGRSYHRLLGAETTAPHAAQAREGGDSLSSLTSLSSFSIHQSCQGRAAHQTVILAHHVRSVQPEAPLGLCLGRLSHADTSSLGTIIVSSP
jgi:hypothetical protein